MCVARKPGAPQPGLGAEGILGNAAPMQQCEPVADLGGIMSKLRGYFVVGRRSRQIDVARGAAFQQCSQQMMCDRCAVRRGSRQQRMCLSQIFRSIRAASSTPNQAGRATHLPRQPLDTAYRPPPDRAARRVRRSG